MRCKHCGYDTALRNPSGYCDHLYYPEACEVCNAENIKRQRVEKAAPNLLKALKQARKVLHMVEWCADNTMEVVDRAIVEAEGGL